MQRIAILISGAGSNMRALINAANRNEIPAQVALVLADRDAAGLTAARASRIDTRIVHPNALAPREEHDQRIMQELQQARIDWVILAGYMRILSANFVEAWTGRMLNIHPSLLPRHKGLHTHRRALSAGDHRHGCTVHFVTTELDGGPAVLQASFAIKEDDDEHSLRARVQRCEHQIYPEVVAWLTAGRLRWTEGCCLMDGQALREPIQRQFNEDFFVARLQDVPS